MRNSFIFYRSFFETFSKLPREERLDLFEAVCNYALNDEDPGEMSGIGDAIFTLLKPQLDANTRKYENGLRGGRPKPKHNQNETKTKPKHNLDETKPKPNDNDNDNVNVNENENVNGSGYEPDDSARSATLSSSLCSYLNEKTGGSHQPTSDMQVRVAVLLSQGYTEADMRAVIDKKTEEWLDVPKMRQYLRPSTLFGKKFEQYLAEPESSGTQQRKKKSKRAAAVREDLDGARDELDSVLSLMERIRGRPGGIESEEYGELADQRMVLEQRVEQLSKQLERLEER